MKRVKRPEEYSDKLSHNNGLYNTIIEGDKYAFNVKHIKEEICGFILWAAILMFEYINKSFGIIWKIGLFFVIAIGSMWLLRITWWFLYHVVYDWAMKTEAKERERDEMDN